MYSLSKIKRGLKHPKLLLREVNRLYYTKFRSWRYNKNGIDIFEEEWDNLIVLDACRYKLVDNKIEGNFGTLGKRTSRGSSTLEFVKGNFKDKDLRDTVYVTANPHFTKLRDDLNVDIHEVIDVWDSEGWNSIYDTVMPEDVREEAENASEKYGDKRLVIHFMQPHYPFLDDEGRIPEGVSNIWHKAFQGDLDIDPEEAWAAYEETFEKVWEEVEELIDELDGRTIVTADHGNVYDERVSPIPVREWGHPIGIYDEKLVKVPWMVLEAERRDIEAGDVAETEDIDEEEVKEKLAALGYSE